MKYTIKILKNFDHKQAVTLKSNSKEQLIEMIMDLATQNNGDVCTADYQKDGYASAELTYVECYHNWEISEDGGKNSEYYTDMTKAARAFAFLAWECSHIITES